MSERVPEHPIFIVDLTGAIRAESAEKAQVELADRLRAVGRERDPTAEFRYPRQLARSVPLFSALARLREAAVESIDSEFSPLDRLDGALRILAELMEESPDFIRLSTVKAHVQTAYEDLGGPPR